MASKPTWPEVGTESLSAEAPTRRRPRADALRNIDAVLAAAIAVFKDKGVEAPVKEIADRAGVGVGTLYRHYPRRSDLIKAVFQREVDTCADAAAALAANEAPLAALRRWMDRYVELIATKRGLAGTLHSDDPAFDTLADYFVTKLEPALASLLKTAAANGDIRSDIAAEDLMRAVANVCQPAETVGIAYSLRMVALLVDGLRFGAKASR
ncbi:MAG: helix-turn-helix domain containing protein [Caulobacteraceae bacterium]|nr:helix-turn-helix domain containing protein [Caulobacteraceae bacterium]